MQRLLRPKEKPRTRVQRVSGIWRDKEGSGVLRLVAGRRVASGFQ